MLALKGIYQNGIIKFDKPIEFDKPIQVIVTFIDEQIKLKYQIKENSVSKKGLDIKKFSFMQSIEASQSFKGSFSESLIEERRTEL